MWVSVCVCLSLWVWLFDSVFMYVSVIVSVGVFLWFLYFDLHYYNPSAWFIFIHIYSKSIYNFLSDKSRLSNKTLHINNMTLARSPLIVTIWLCVWVHVCVCVSETETNTLLQTGKHTERHTITSKLFIVLSTIPPIPRVPPNRLRMKTFYTRDKNHFNISTST